MLCNAIKQLEARLDNVGRALLLPVGENEKHFTMKKQPIIAIVATLFIGTCAWAQTGRDLTDDGLHGAVKRVDAIMYEAAFNSHDSIEHGDQMEHLVTEYNNKAQRRSQTYLSVAENIIFRTRYKHDGFGLTTLEHVVDNNDEVIGRTYYIYDADNVLTETYVEDEERQIECRMLISHDAQRRISERSYNDHKNNIFKREVYTYNPDGTINKAVVYDRMKRKVQEKRWEYDSHGEPTSYTLYDYTEAEVEMFVTLYERRYDAHGNWVKCVEYELLGDRKLPLYSTVRKIEYF